MYDIIIYEGLDRSGKSTTKKAMEALTNYKYICYDRSYLTAICYEKIKKRNNNLQKYYDDFKKLCINFKVLVIYCNVSDAEIIKKRIIDENEKVLFTSEVKELINIFDNETALLIENKQCDVYIIDMNQCSKPLHYEEQAAKLVKELKL